MTWSEISYDIDTLETKKNPLWWQKKNLSYTSSGYGGKIPTTNMIKLPNEKIWRRLYCCIYSNSGTCYIVVKGENRIVR